VNQPPNQQPSNSYRQGSRGLGNIHSINFLIQTDRTVAGSSFSLHQDNHSLDGSDPLELSYSHIVVLYVDCDGTIEAASRAVAERLVFSALTDDVAARGLPVPAVAGAEEPQDPPAMGTATGLGVAGHAACAEFSSQGISVCFPSCVFHQSVLPAAGKYTWYMVYGALYVILLF
jgi:hypothetical protein